MVTWPCGCSHLTWSLDLATLITWSLEHWPCDMGIWPCEWPPKADHVTLITCLFKVTWVFDSGHLTLTVVTSVCDSGHLTVRLVTWQFDSGHLTVWQWSPDSLTVVTWLSTVVTWLYDNGYLTATVVPGCMTVVTWLRQSSPDCGSGHLIEWLWSPDHVTVVTWMCDTSPIWPWPCSLETFAHREQVKRLPLQMLDKQFSKDSEHHCVKGTSESLFKKSADSKEKNYFLWLL